MTYSIDDFILSLFAHGHKVRASTLYQLLKGKRTISIISYGFLYDVLRYFAIFSRLPDYQYQEIIDRLLRSQCLLERDGKVMITTKGKKHLNDCQLSISFEHLNSFKHYRHDESFKNLLLFIIQVTSELSYDNNEYVPIELNGYQQMLVKRWLASQLADISKKELVDQLANELSEVSRFFNDDEIKGSLLFGQMSGHEWTGYTLSQLSAELGISSIEAVLRDRELMHHLIDLLDTNPDQIPLLKTIFQLVARYPYNQSAHQSYELFKKTCDFQYVMNQRRIKQSTLEEHLLEFAIIDEKFPYDFFLHPELLQVFIHLNELFPNEKEWSFKVIETNSQVPVTYFEMRLYQIYKQRMTNNGSSI
ncbi:helix-turn-helix domain-containing protein [Vagococcus zengguangii]|uniref:Helicase Helix-turn-helix domain-containing protein n=1 Tax=Vagococcus zengguangii TaxID=2571750 RepID=A0A4D7CTN3_9ENTE|nr:helix-turn-helix domain-containing protein [Vagococcus zengguangii]QCI86484.1 hypothetical protein FA707_05655 [Vagococcus zengguangii]TLG81266.1 hypothetical protein FE258_01960 [Vagococcus zengguangii]